jgi:cyclase
VHRYTGDVRRSGEADRDTLEWLREAQDRGAGEIVLNCMGSDGVRRGYDIEQLAAARERCHVPLVASGGAGETAHFIEVFRAAGVDAALAASVFHSGELPIPRLKSELRGAGILVRPPTTASRPPCTSPPII